MKSPKGASSKKPLTFVRKVEQAIWDVECIRTNNNSLWMKVLKIALIYAPTQTKHLLRGINRNDAAITKKLKKIAVLK